MYLWGGGRREGSSSSESRSPGHACIIHPPTHPPTHSRRFYTKYEEKGWEVLPSLLLVLDTILSIFIVRRVACT